LEPRGGGPLAGAVGIRMYRRMYPICGFAKVGCQIGGGRGCQIRCTLRWLKAEIVVKGDSNYTNKRVISKECVYSCTHPCGLWVK
jgi:hypothetical protein